MLIPMLYRTQYEQKQGVKWSAQAFFQILRPQPVEMHRCNLDLLFQGDADRLALQSRRLARCEEIVFGRIS